MKKTLLLASAAVLFAGTAQATGLELGIEGYASVYGVYADQDVEKAEFGIKKEIELDFTGEVALDNGLTVGVTVETTAEDDDNGQEQEAYIFVEGGFGKAIVGSEYNAAYLMQVTAPAVDAEFDGADATYNVVTSPNFIADGNYAMYGDANHPTDGDDNAGADKITYISPIWENLQVGASYTPNTEDEGERGEMDSEQDEAFSVAARYSAEDVLGADWTLGAGWNTMAKTDVDEWNIAAVAEKDAWTAGVAYYDYEDDSSDSEIEVYAVGVNYETGAFTYGASYLNKEDESKDKLNRYMAGVNYAYGPGMSLNGSIGYHDYDGSSASDEGDATIVAVGTVINF